MPELSRELYDRTSADWSREDPTLLSDFTARPFLLEWCEPLNGADVLDVGCGEGYFTRRMHERGAGKVVGVDLSSAMIRGAEEREKVSPRGIQYLIGDAARLQFSDASFDLVVAVFCLNNLIPEDMQAAMGRIHGMLRPEGRFVFVVPHPFFPFISESVLPLFFGQGDVRYFSDRGRILEGKMGMRGGGSVKVLCVHKTLQDYFECLGRAGFTSIPELCELGVTDEHMRLAPEFFGPLRDKPLHLTFRCRKAG